MLYHQLLPVFLAALAIASPTPQDTKTIKLADGTTMTVSPSVDDKRSLDQRDIIRLADGTTMTVSPAVDDKRSLNEKRGDDKISSCGPKSGWTPVEDHGLHLDLVMWGYRSAVQAFCSRAAFALNPDGTATPVVVAAGTRISYTVRWENDKEGLADNERGHRVGLKNDVPGHIECKTFESGSIKRYGELTNYSRGEQQARQGQAERLCHGGAKLCQVPDEHGRPG